MTDNDAIMSLTRNPAFWLVLAWVARELISMMHAKSKEAVTALKENTAEIQKLTIALAETKIEVVQLKEAIKVLPKMKTDIDVAHSRLRQLGKEFDQEENL